jgi:hypothetical protein
MSVKLAQAFNSLAELKIWFRDQSGEKLKLSDVSDIISLRWTYFRDNWEFIRDSLVNKAELYEYPDRLITQVDSLGRFIERQRNSANKKINPFRKSTVLTDYYAVWENIDVSSIPITRQEQGLIDSRLATIRRFVKTDFQRIRSDIVAARDEIADVVGLSDDAYNASKDRSSVAQLRDVRISDITNMQTLHTGIIATDYILANISTLDTISVDTFLLARSNANNPDIEIAQGRSGRLVRMNYGDSLQDLAARYFGDPDRWIEIAIANGLRPPYIDEIGQTIPIISNGDGNQINIAKTDPFGNNNIDKLYINQAVFLKSDATTAPEQRSIINIKEIPISGEIVIELDGPIDLDRYTIIDNAHIRIYKQNTINSQFLILIPSEQPLPQGRVGEEPFFLKSLAEDEKNSGVDLAVDSDMDIVFTSTSDLDLSFGISNAVQAIKYKIMSERGQLPRHPDFGLTPVMGQKATDPEEIKQALINSINGMINADSRFSRIETLDISQPTGNQMVIRLSVRMAGTGTVIPISFSVNTG